MYTHLHFASTFMTFMTSWPHDLMTSWPHDLKTTDQHPLFLQTITQAIKIVFFNWFQRIGKNHVVPKILQEWRIRCFTKHSRVTVMARKTAIIKKNQERAVIIGAGITERWYFSHMQSLFGLKVKIRPRYFGNESIFQWELETSALSHAYGILREKAPALRTAVCRTARTVVWEVGKHENRR